MSAINKIDYKQLGEAIAVSLNRAVPPNRIVWDGSDCADYLKISHKYFIDRISKDHRFPAPIRIPSGYGSKRGNYRWYAEDVIKWLEKQRVQPGGVKPERITAAPTTPPAAPDVGGLVNLLIQAKGCVAYQRDLQNTNHEAGRRHYADFDRLLNRIDSALSAYLECKENSNE